MVHSLDRWSRNLRVTLDTFKRLADHKVAFVSITENIDYSTPEGRLFIAMIGAFAQYFSDSLSKRWIASTWTWLKLVQLWESGRRAHSTPYSSPFSISRMQRSRFLILKRRTQLTLQWL